MVTIYKFKATKENQLIMLDHAIMENILSFKSKLFKEGVCLEGHPGNWCNYTILSCLEGQAIT
ncbi:hypothetical protein H5410_060092 [Solanum commersonii]|uniref:Uncharacterized protein n=1 Tax=Solanum commersonii TaxID=4109 RepID=A0A9J5W5H9_SOLCO|nr:hypothetical protein H5410_060092 [Solanum commersonii]